VALWLVMALLPQGQEVDSTREVVDFVYSLFIFLLLTVLMLGSLAAMLLLGSGYVEALLQTLLVTGVVLMLLGLVANPRSGFAGIGSVISRYLMSIGLPVEQWLQALSNLALREEDPHAFLEQACVEIAQRLPWVKGGEWIAGGNRGAFGACEGRRWEFSHGGMVLVLYTLHAPSPTLIWHYNLLAQLLAQFHADKQRALALKQLSYMRAIHETGARLTHDVKNLLQSLNTLCSAGLEPGAETSPAYQSLLRRQLPAITDRLAETLGKLNAPQGNRHRCGASSAAEWWRELGQRLSTLEWIIWKAMGCFERRGSAGGVRRSRRQPRPQCRREALARAGSQPVDTALSRRIPALNWWCAITGRPWPTKLAAALVPRSGVIGKWLRHRALSGSAPCPGSRLQPGTRRKSRGTGLLPSGTGRWRLAPIACPDQVKAGGSRVRRALGFASPATSLRPIRRYTVMLPLPLR
jgi:hypothetical protein